MIRVVCGILFAVCMFTGFSAPVQARSISPLDGLEALRKGFAGTSDFSADISQEKRLSLMKRTLTMSGTVRFKKPDQFFMEINAPYASRMLLKDTAIEQATGREGEKNRIVLPPEQGLKNWFLKLMAPVTSIPEGVSILAELNNGIYTLSIAPHGKGQIKELNLVFLEDGTIRRLTVNEQNGDRATMTFKKVRRNIGLTDKDFRLD